MLKNNHGVTISMLVVTIVVLLMISAISLTSGSSFVTQVRASKIVANMELVQAKVEIIKTEKDDNEIDSYVGESVAIDNKISEKEKAMIVKGTGIKFQDLIWYKWDKNVLSDQKLDENILGEEQFFLVNYDLKEIIYSEGTEFKDKEDNKFSYYSMTGLKEMLKEY